METFVSVTAIIAAVAVSIGVVAAVYQLCVIRRQHWYQIYLNLIDELSREDSRVARRSIHEAVEKGWSQNSPDLKRHRGEFPNLEDQIDLAVNQLDKIGYFLDKQSALAKDAPEWLWEITAAMWDKVGWYVVDQRTSTSKPYRKHYGEYFEKLHKKAKKRYQGASEPTSPSGPRSNGPPEDLA